MAKDMSGVSLLAPLSEEEKEKRWQSSAWLPRHNLVCQLHAVGMKNSEIAAATGYSQAKVSIILNDPRAKQVIQKSLESLAENITDLHTRLKVHAVEALDEIVDELRESKDERIRQKAAFGLLDRAGYTPVQKQVVFGATIDEAVAKRMEKAQEKMEVIDAEYEVFEPASADGDEASPSD